MWQVAETRALIADGWATIRVATNEPSSAPAWVLDSKCKLNSPFDFPHALGSKLYDQCANRILGNRLDIVEIDGA